MENLKKTLEAAGCTFADLVSATRFLTDVNEQDDLNRVWAAYLGGHLPTTTTVEVSRLATHARCKIEISAIAVADRGSGPDESVGFVGLGTMGGRMARRLLAAGRPVVGYNRTPAKARPLVAAGLCSRNPPARSPKPRTRSSAW